MAVAVGWIRKFPTSVIVSEVRLTSKTVSKIISSFRDLISVWLEETSRKVGAVGHIVEIDESALGRRKYNRGRLCRTKCVVGGINQPTRNTFLCVVDKRDSKTLEIVITKYVSTGTCIETNM